MPHSSTDPSRVLAGDEPLAGTRLTVLDFWRWSASNLLDNTLRGHLAEFLVASACGAAHAPRSEWDPVDVVTPSGIKVEVKSAAYCQSWAQLRPSAIEFGIRPTKAWDAATGAYESETRRQADVYVFALLAEKDASLVDPLDIGQWRFFVIAASALDASVGEQKTIRLKPLLALGLVEASYVTLATTVRGAVPQAT